MTYSIEAQDAYINSLGLDSYRVGGSVRDELLGKTSKDADYVIFGVSLYELWTKLGESHIKRGQYPRISKLITRDGVQIGWRAGNIEIALPRTEESTGPGHADFKITLDSSLSLRKDAERRDFTFNALYKNVATGDVVDPLGTGIPDLQRGKIQVAHAKSFREDPLRMLRAIRFVSTLGYTLTSATYVLMELDHDAVRAFTNDSWHTKKGLVQGGTSGTVLQELERILMGEFAADALVVARDTGLLGSLIPEIAPMLGHNPRSQYHDMTTDEHTFLAIQKAGRFDAPLRVKMALLFHDSGKPDAEWVDEKGNSHYYSAAIGSEDFGFWITQNHEAIGVRNWIDFARRVNAPKDLRNDVATLIGRHMLNTDKKESKARVAVGRLRVNLGDDMLHDLILHRTADMAAKNKINKEALNQTLAFEQYRRELAYAKVPASVKDLQITGGDLVEAGRSGPAIGVALSQVLDEVVVDPSETKLTREWQLQRALQVAK